MTLIELLVAMTVGLVVTLIALSMLILGRSGYSAVDSTTQLLDKERFIVDTVSRIVMQAGYQDYAAPTLTTRSIATALGNNPEPDLFAWNNAIYKAPADLVISETANMVDGNRPGLCTVNDTSCKNGSDVLLVRFQGGTPDATPPDDTMVNCVGNRELGSNPGDLDKRAANMFYVNRDASGEPSLYCAYYNFSTAAWVAGQPLIEGVEAMQLLFGTDNVTAATAPAAGGQNMIVDRWLRADQLKVAGDAVATKENWRRVRAVRVGLVLRGPPGSAQERVSETFRPLGAQYTSTADTGAELVTAADGRLRRVLNFTVHIRNDLSTR